jgi:hypothetical protein
VHFLTLVSFLQQISRSVRDTVFVLQSDEPFWKVILECIAAFATAGALVVAIIETRRAREEAHLREKAELKFQRAVDHQIGAEALGASLQIRALTYRLDRGHDPMPSLVRLEPSLRRMASLVPEASKDVAQLVRTAFGQFYYAYNLLEQVPLNPERKSGAQDEAFNVLTVCSNQLWAVVPPELL